MHNVVKMLLGLAILAVGIWTMVDPAWFGQSSMIYGLGWWNHTWDIVKGSLGPILILTGFVVIWIAYEENKS